MKNKLAITARALLGAACFAAVALPALPAAAKTPEAAPAPAAQHPRNIIFVLVDDLRYDGMGFLQPGLLKTPNIDRMAKEGTYFPNAVVTSSLCSPSRATILTGQTARNHGVVDNNDSSEEGLTFFPKYLQQVGYDTAFFGKWHMGASTDAPRPGFDKWVSFMGQGNYWPAKQAGPHSSPNLNVDGKEVPQKGYITDELTDYAMNWLTKERDPKKPFFLYLSHKGVHSDPLPPPRYAHQYDDAKFTLPASAADTPENNAGKPVWVQNQRNTWHGIDFFYNADVPMTEYLKYYYGTLSAIDDSLGRIMTYLRKNHLEKDTLVVFTSDNGFMTGEHGLIDKRNAYEASIRVPLVVWEPGTVPANAVNTGRIRNLDFAPTFLDVAGAQRPPQFEGSSAWPLWKGKIEAADWKPGDFTYEYYWEYNFPMTPGTFAIERDRIKYIQYYGVYDIDELYDLRNDPEEMHNLAEDPRWAAKKQELRIALYEQLANSEGKHSIPYSARLSTGAVRRSVNGPHAADFPKEWYIKPNPTDRLDPILPDTPYKLQQHAAGKPVIYTPPLAQELKRQVDGDAK
ncbi:MULTISPECIES: sulfatase [unclassified Novosphingobium]|uniref:sulfatase family protein n=1 Tax=unclassified Novosphingobium TaxID=2644732 RepID=UPI00020EE73B|nr:MULTISPECIES: sulfatase [unclassified Novosphingobium]GFM27955.1 sulfatase [Novosphingobium sp. PY1]CCA91124.1 putative N-acetylglucosamine-6-sulfatase [Novosphingobium sp. PP1Y]